MRNTFLVYTPFTGLGLYGGSRGNRWLRNRIAVFKRFVIPSLLNQTDRNFVHWISWREEDRGNKYIKELEEYLSEIPNYKFVFTYNGITIWDDKYEEKEARERLVNSLVRTLPQLFDYAPDCEEIYWLLQPSDDLYDKMTVESVRKAFKEDPSMQAVVYTEGYMCNYTNKDLAEYNPKTLPPFCAIRFPRETFFDAGKHMTYIALKEHRGKYKKGTPQPSHEYLEDCLKTARFKGRGFLVGCHGENVSTHFNHPYKGKEINGVDKAIILNRFGIADAEALPLPISIRKKILRMLPHSVQRKLRYWFGEKIYQRIYNFLRN